MKKKVNKYLIILLVLISLLSFNQIIQVKADSGFDTSYGSDGGSSHDSSFHDGGRSSDDYTDSNEILSYITWSTILFIIVISIFMFLFEKVGIFVLIYIFVWEYFTYIKGIVFMMYVAFFSIWPAILILSVIAYLNTRKIIKKEIKERKKFETELLDDINKYFDISIEELKQVLYDNFVKIQIAWMNFDYESLRKLCNDNIYNMYYEELEAFKLTNGQNIMNNFVKCENRIIGFSSINNIITLDYYLDVKFYDYIINTKTHKVEKGSKRIKVHNIYILTYTKSIKENNICPNCGAKVESNSTKCSHCKAVIVKDSSEFVLSKKRKIG